MQEQLLDISKQPVLEHRLQPCSMRTILQSSDNISKECRTDSGTHFPSGIISLHRFSLRERLTSAMSLRNISLENYSYEMLKTHYHELFITTRTSIQDPSIRPQGGSRSNTFFIIEQGDYEGEEGFWVEDDEGLEGFMSNNDEETFWVLEENDAFIARKVSGRNFKFKKRKGKSGNKKDSPQRGGFKPFRKSGSGGKANMANENYDPYDQAYWGKGTGKKGKKGKSKFQYQFQYPYDGNKGYPSYESGKGKSGQEKGKPKTFAAMERTWLVLIP